MNCKPGDLAVIVRTFSAHDAHHIGKIVKVVSVCPKTSEKYKRPYWNVLIGSEDTPENAAADACLKPLRDNPGQDETLNWAPVPTKEGTW